MDNETLESMVDSFLADGGATETEIDEAETVESEDSAVEAETEETTESYEDENSTDEEVTQSGETEESEEGTETQTESISRGEFNHIMAQQRIAQKEEKARLRAIEAEKLKNDEIIEALMASSGYSDRESFEKAVEMARREKMKQETGLDDKALDKINEINKREAEINMKASMIEQREIEAKAYSINNGVSSLAEGAGISPEQAYQILDERGVTLDMLLSSPAPDMIVRGALADVYAKSQAEKSAEFEASRPSVNTNKLPKGEKGIDEGEYSIDSILAEAMNSLDNNQGGY